MCLTLSDYDRDTYCEAPQYFDRSSHGIQAPFWQETVQTVLKIHFLIMGITNTFSCTYERHIPWAYQPVESEQVFEEYSGTGNIQEVCGSDQQIFIRFAHGHWRYHSGKKRQAYWWCRLGIRSHTGKINMGNAEISLLSYQGKKAYFLSTWI